MLVDCQLCNNKEPLLSVSLLVSFIINTMDTNFDLSYLTKLGYDFKKKTVSFDLAKNQKKVLYTYSFASSESRNGSSWICMALDSLRFKKRIKAAEENLNTILSVLHRTKIYNERL